MKKTLFYYSPIIILYIIVNILSISTYPFVHSDETWLAGLSKTIASYKNFEITEPFFKLYPRQPHAIKSLFHLVQGKWMAIFGYNIASVRTLSLIIGLFFLCTLMAYLVRRPIRSIRNEGLNHNKSALIHMGAASTLLCAFSAQFMYAAHFGRQEVFILLFMLLSYMLVEKGVYYNPRSHAGKYAFGAALITACAIGFHPNSFLIACITGCVLIADSIVHKRIQPLMTYVLTTGTAAALYIFISLSWNAGFIADYNAFGDTLGATLTPMEKLKAFPLFLFKLYHQISATYFTPDIRADLIMGLLVFILAGALIFTTIIKKSKRKTHVDTALIALPMFSTLGLTAGLIIIGRYNATSIVFYLLFLALCTHGILFNQYKKHCLKATPLYTRSLLSATVILILIVGLNGFRQVVSKPIENYTDYTSKIHHAVTLDSNDRALCNLNAGFAFKPDQFVDYRDLGMLKAKNISIDSYLDSNHIEYIILSEEMDYIYRNQDPWTILYGDMSYYPRLVELIERDYRLVEAFNSPLYGMRITRYNDGYPWRVAVYKLNN